MVFDPSQDIAASTAYASKADGTFQPSVVPLASGNTPQTYEDQQSALEKSGVIPGYKAPPKSPVGMIDTGSAISQVNQQKGFIDNTYPTPTSGSGTPTASGANPPSGGTPSTGGTTPAPTGTTGKAYFTNQSGQEAEYTQDQLASPDIQSFLKNNGYVLVKSDGVNVSGDFTTKTSSDAADAAAKKVEDLTNNFLSYDVGKDPAFKAQSDVITAQFAQLRRQMEKTNFERQRAFETLGLRGGTTQYAGGVEMTIEGEELSQGNQRIADINAQEANAISSARTAFENGQYNKFNAQVNALKDLRDQKQKVLADYNKNIADTLTQLRQKEKDAATAVQQKFENDRAIANDKYNQVQKPIDDIAIEAAKFNAPPSVIASIKAATSAGDAIAAASGYLQDPTSTGGMYSAYLKAQQPGGKIMTPGEFVAAQKAAEAEASAIATNKVEAKYSYAKAYNAAAGKLAADAKYADSSANQQKLEKEYTANLVKELSNRTGDLGIQNGKVSQAIHLKSLIDQNTTTDAKGNKHYNITPQQQVELSIGVANLLAGGSTGASEKTIENITASTASGDFRKAIQYATGVPQKGPSDSIVKNLLDTIERQGAVAEDLRSNYLAQFRATKPTDLSADRAAEVEKIQNFPSFKNPVQNIEQAARDADNLLKAYGQAHPEKVQEILKNEATIKANIGHQPSAAEFREFFPEYFQ